MALRSARLALIVLTLGTTAACGWFAGSSDQGSGTTEEDPAAARPTCRPPGAVATRGETPWTKGMATSSGWQVTAIDFQEVPDPAQMPEYVRVFFKKDGVETALEIAYNDGSTGDWSTAHYRLMPAPDQEPPEGLLKETIDTLRSWDAKHGDTPFVAKREGVIDPYEGLPPCAPGEEPT